MVTYDDGELRRDSQATRRRILDALGRMIVEGGLAKVGVNALARDAGCDKVLIYRYFGDLDGVYQAFAAQMRLLVDARRTDRRDRTRRAPAAEALKRSCAATPRRSARAR